MIPFLDIPQPKKFGWVVLPVPYERTTTYRQGTARGPAAVLEATAQVEFYDHRSGSEPCSLGVGTDLAWRTAFRTLTLDRIQRRVEHWLARGVRTAILGGEHTVTLPAIRAYKKYFGDFAVVQWDAHADLRETYGGTPYNHACVMRRVWEEGVFVLPLGIRALSIEEARFLERGRRPAMFADALDLGRFGRLLDRLPDRVYLTVDADAFDPAIVPTTGTPEPGGLSWWQANAFLDLIAQKKTLIGMDLVEAMPIRGQEHGIFACARFFYRMVGAALLQKP